MLDPELRAALDRVLAADKAHTDATEALNTALVELVNAAASKVKPK